jgi:DNA-binding transcriptional regulator YiaG
MTPEDFRAARLRLGMTQAELAVALGYTHKQVVSAIETGKRKPGTAVRLLLAALIAQSGRTTIRSCP